MTNTVYCYYQPLAGFGDPSPLLSLWKASWAQRGWKTVVLDEADARKHRAFEEVAQLVSRLPSVNPTEYHKACIYRWLALATAGGGLLTDYDMIDYSFSPERQPDVRYCLASDAGWFMSPEDVDRLIDVLRGFFVGEHSIDFINGRPNVCDMVLRREMQGLFADLNVSLCYGRPGWEGKDIVHFSTDSCKTGEKAEVVQRVRPVRTPLKLDELVRREDFGMLLNAMGLLGSGVEVGTAYGFFAAILRHQWKGQRLICVDPYAVWPDYDEPFNNLESVRIHRASARKITGSLGIDLWEVTSEHASLLVADESQDFVYIDANHAAWAAAHDMELWWPKVKKGGFLCGHDYYQVGARDVKTAVDAFVAKRGLPMTVTNECSSWWIVKQ